MVVGAGIIAMVWGMALLNVWPCEKIYGGESGWSRMMFEEAFLVGGGVWVAKVALKIRPSKVLLGACRDRRGNFCSPVSSTLRRHGNPHFTSPFQA